VDVEAEYRKRIDTMSVGEKVRRADALFRWSRGYLARVILSAEGPMSGERLAREIALRTYGADPAARELIEVLFSGRAAR
jgi:hypothetical protein